MLLIEVNTWAILLFLLSRPRDDARLRPPHATPLRDHITHDVAQATVWRAWRVMKPMLRRGPSTTAFTPAARRHLCIPWRLRAELARCGLAPERDAYTNFLVYPLDWLWPRANQALSQLLTRMSVVRIVACTGCQYMVAARRPR